MNRSSLVLLITAFCMFPAFAAAETLTVTSWGGAYEASQRAAYFDPYTKSTGTKITLKPYNGGIAGLKGDGAAVWDVLDMTEPDALAACEAGLLAPVELGRITNPPDFIDDALSDCGVVHLVYSTVIAYNDRAFPGIKPQSVADFFDLRRFPGKRALQKQPIAILEWALMAQGVPISQLYDLLSTERGMRLAFRKLDSIRDHIIWWETGADAPQLLKDGKAVMASGYNGRFFDARISGDAPVTIVWDGQLLDTSVWAIARSSSNKQQAMDLIAFATQPQAMASLASHIPYGPARRSALKRIGLHAHSNVPMLHHMPTAPANLARAIRTDSIWYARTKALRERRFEAWLAGKEQ